MELGQSVKTVFGSGVIVAIDNSQHAHIKYETFIGGILTNGCAWCHISKFKD